MPRIRYSDRKLQTATLELIETANEIIEAYAAQGFSLTLRQLYYQFVARDLIPNTTRDYKRLGEIINNARLGGLIDWNHIVDRTRRCAEVATWEGPSDIVSGAASQYKRDLWENQDYRVEVWVEKDALSDVIATGCEKRRVPYLVCRGYTSQSAMWRAGQRLLEYRKAGREPVIIHLGDHDPSGIDMTRDIHERLEMFSEGSVEMRRIALTIDQVEEFGPPPNPAKMTDTRASDYVEQFGYDSWELDALEPRVLSDLIEEQVDEYVDEATWDELSGLEKEERTELRIVSSNWEDVVDGEFTGVSP